MEFKLPELGESVDSGVVLQVMVSEGDHVDEGQTVLELETDKATTEVPSPAGGTVKKVHVSKGDEVKTGQSLLTIDGGDGDEGDEEEEKAEAKEEGEEEAEAKGGDGEEEGEEKAEAKGGEEERERGGERGRERERGGERGREREGQRARGGSKGLPPGREGAGGRAVASPKIRQLARELGIDVGDVAATGDEGRVTEEDVLSHARALLEEARARRSGEPEGPQLPDFSRWGEIERAPLGPIRRATAENVARSWSLVPHVSQFDRADITELSRFREKHGKDVEEAGGKLTVTAILVKVAAEALRRYPSFNASLDLERGERIVKRYIHVGVAVDTEGGLLVPVVRDADQHDLKTISADLVHLAERAREQRLGRDEMEGASFTITNLGGLGTTQFTPIVPWPQVAILGVGRASVEAVWKDNAFVPRTILPLCITYDHRAVDGADAARFLRTIAEGLEQPLSLFV